MSADVVRGLIALGLAALMFVASQGVPPIRRRALMLSSGGIACLGLSNLAASLGLASGLATPLTGLGLGLIFIGAFFLIRSWQAGELRQQVERFREEAARERERRERERGAQEQSGTGGEDRRGS